jgi:hypothetical protein
MNMSLDTLLDEAAAKVETFLSVTNRSHAALHACIASCYAVYLTAKQDEAALTGIATRLGVEVTGDALEPLALLSVKVVFHNVSDQTYDLRRHFSKWSMAVAHLEEAGISPEEVPNYLGNGGIVGCVNLYRETHPFPSRFEREVENLRRIEEFVKGLPKIGSVTKTADDEQLCVINSAKDQKTLNALAQQPSRVLLLGAVDDNFNLTVTCIVEREGKAVEQYLLRKAKAANVPSSANDNSVETENRKEVA